MKDSLASLRGHMSEGCYSDLMIDRVLAGELDGTPEGAAFFGHVASCSICRERKAALGEAQRHPPSLARLAFAARARRTRRARPWVGVAFAAAALLMLVVVRRPAPNDERLPHADDTQVKGGGLAADLVVRRHGSGRVEAVGPGDVLHPGDAIRVRVRSPRAGYLVVMGLDGRGAVTPYVPAAEGASLPVKPGETTPEGSVVLDDSVGHEQLIAAVCDSPEIAARAADAARRAVRGAGTSDGVRQLDIPCLQTRLPFRKELAP
jgi:Domain of unknown function (DUF4384)